MIRPALLLLLALALTPAPAAADATEGPVDWTAYAAVLAQHTRAVPDIAQTRVDYAALRSAPAWRRVVGDLDGVDPETLPGPRARMAFWINAYNILAIDIVVQHGPVESIRDIGSLLSPVWKKPAGRVGGRSVTLHEIEHEILRPLGDPRIHGAIVCASLSCPPLRREPYRAEPLEAQLEDNVRAWLRDPRKGVRVDAEDDTLYLSKILDWFDDDFDAGGGVLAFVAPYLTPEDRRFVERRGADADIEYLDYDWSLNALASGT